MRTKYAEKAQKALEFYGRDQTRMVTFTIRHHRGEGLAYLLKGIKKAMQRFEGGKWWHALKLEMGLRYLIAFETTHGMNGWHVHFHALWFMDKPELLDTNLTLALMARWQNMVRKVMGEEHAPDQAIGFQIDEYHDGDAFYMLGIEATDAAGAKKGCGNHRSIWQIAAAYCARGRKRDADLFVEYVRATRGRTAMKASRGLWEHIGQPKEDPKLDELDDDPLEGVGTIDDPLWNEVRDEGRKPAAIVKALVRGGMVEVQKVFEGWGFKVKLTDLGNAGPPVLHLRR